jgi:hypothetical protein
MQFEYRIAMDAYIVWMIFIKTICQTIYSLFGCFDLKNRSWFFRVRDAFEKGVYHIPVDGACRSPLRNAYARRS